MRAITADDFIEFTRSCNCYMCINWRLSCASSMNLICTFSRWVWYTPLFLFPFWKYSTSSYNSDFITLYWHFIPYWFQMTFISNACKYNSIKTSLINNMVKKDNTLYKTFLLLWYLCSRQMITCFCYLENIFQVIERRAAIKHTT